MGITARLLIFKFTSPSIISGILQDFDHLAFVLNADAKAHNMASQLNL